MNFLKKLFAKSLGPTPVNDLEKALQGVLANPKKYEDFHKKLLQSEVLLLGKTSENGNLDLVIKSQENFSVVYLFTSEKILNDMAKKEKRENLEWVALSGQTFFESVKEETNLIVYININCDKMEYILFPEERIYFSSGQN